ncbi:hypothetical protein BGW36DRAFT_302345 [Talaromyces proteolyticus]|uniref:Uracil catabolism protein 4 n=1 Tax=Talaromyces proteolyticus TaxID=1131652 RepID=A0AAD4PXJ8_9EURO|nr:uncharacterized protein BGW36DRAFT_302345 [Talaromyces proteolyticus]KAH8693211.1 hypothetical protein BGW36DRAFT_302345 [Talaromyces proteolyticus]
MANPDIAYLLSLEAVRERAKTVLRAAEAGSLNNFDYHKNRMPEAADFVVGIIQRDFGPDRFNEIPPHGRWQHFDVGGVARIVPLLEEWTAQEGIDNLEATRRLIDLFVVSVLLDAGAGDVWTFNEPETGNVYNRSEGIAVASLYMVLSGALNSSGTSEPTVDASGLIEFTDESFIKFFQVTEENPIIGVSSRVGLLNNVGRSLKQLSEVVGPTGRPGNIVDYLVAASEDNILDYKLMWSVLQRILIPSWPADRPIIQGQPVGDAWPLQVLSQAITTGSSITTSTAGSIQPFHKLTQWLGYSIIVPFVRILGMKVTNEELGTGLPEYRNGGLFIDLGILSLKPEIEQQHTAAGEDLPRLPPTADAIVEWRAMTVALLDELFVLVSSKFAEQGTKLSMAQMLEAGTWKGGRELAAKLRPETKSSPIILDGDGTLF